MPSNQTRRPSSLQSPYTCFFGTSYAPSPSERTELEALISGAQQELIELDSEISRIHVQRNRVQNFLDEHRNLLSPIRRLPIETMAEIFMHCLPTHRFPIRSLKEAPLLLTMVCRRWREIAMAHPRLWSALHIHVASEIAPNARELELRQQGIRRWIARSGALPLSFSLSFDKIRYDPQTVPAHSSLLAFLSALMNLGPRLETLHLEVGMEIYTLLETFSPRTFPLLKRLSLRSLGMGANSVDKYSKIPFVSRIAGMPILAGLCINGFYPVQHLESLVTYLTHGSNLTELDLGANSSWSLPIQDVLAILRGSPKLQHCCVHVESDSVAQPYETVDLHSLRSLSIRFNGDGEDDSCDLIEKSFRFLNCPALKALSLISKQHDYTIPHRFAFTHLLGSLQHLRMEYKMTDEALIRCLALAPNLTVLEIVDCAYTVDPLNSRYSSYSYHYQVQDTVLHRLTNNPSSPVVLCPKLEMFRLLVPPLGIYGPQEPHRVSISTLALIDFLSSRRGADNQTSKLRECTILIPPESKISALVLERLTHLMQDGMRLRIVHIKTNWSCKPDDDPEQGITYHSSDTFIPFDAYIVQDGTYRYSRKAVLVDNISDSWTFGHLFV